MRANMQHLHLLMLCYTTLRELGLDGAGTQGMVRKAGGVALIRKKPQTIGTYSPAQIHHEIEAFLPLT